MTGEKDLALLLKNMQPCLNEGEFVFCTIGNISEFNPDDALMLFKEKEGYTVILNKEKADLLQLPYAYIARWITLAVHSSLEAVGLTAAFSNALAEAGISCNVVAAFYHDHIFIDKKDAAKAMSVLEQFSKST